MDPFGALYIRRCRYHECWIVVFAIDLICIIWIHKYIEKAWLIRKWLKMARTWQNCNLDVRLRDREFDVDDKVHLKISPMNGVMGLGKKRKHSTYFMGSFKIFRRIGKVSYEINLANGLTSVNMVFHVSLLGLTEEFKGSYSTWEAKAKMMSHCPYLSLQSYSSLRYLATHGSWFSVYCVFIVLMFPHARRYMKTWFLRDVVYWLVPSKLCTLNIYAL